MRLCLHLSLFFLCLPVARTQVPGKRIIDIADSTEAVAYLREWQADQQDDAFWEASVDSLYRRDSTGWVAILHRGPEYRWQSLSLPLNANPELLRWARRAGYRAGRFGRGRPLDVAAWREVRDSLLARVGDAGYPFASAQLTDIEWSAPGLLDATIELRRGPLIRIGELRMPEEARLRNVFVERYLGLLPGAPYSRRRMLRMNERLAQLPYLRVNGPPGVAFRDSLAFIDVPVTRRPASRFDFVIGVLPNSASTGRLLLTGELNGELYNGFGQGERLAARFEQLQPQTQELQVAAEYPYLLGLPFGVEGSLDLYRRDSSFLNLNWRLAATYLGEAADRLSAFWERRSTVVPGLDSAALVDGRLPDTLGVSRSFFGLQLRRVRTDRRFSPRRGYSIDLSAAAGLRRLRGIELTGEVGDSLRARSGQFQIGAAADLYLPAFTATVVYLGLRAQALLATRAVLANEQFRLGGARLLRGFDEQQFFATDYQLLTAEFRLLLGGNAFLYTFVDAARLNQRSVRQPAQAINYPVGFGAGVNFETRAGIFGLSLALGRQRGQSVDPGAPKVHLGYVSVF